MIAVTTCLAFAGCTSIALSQDRKWKLVAGTAPAGRTQRAMRIAGWMLLCLALLVGVAVDGPSFAVLTWILQLAVASFLVAMVLSFRPGLFAPVARAYSVFWR